MTTETKRTWMYRAHGTDPIQWYVQSPDGKEYDPIEILPILDALEMCAEALERAKRNGTYFKCDYQDDSCTCELDIQQAEAALAALREARGVG